MVSKTIFTLKIHKITLLISCADYTANKNYDRNVCLARGCCFDDTKYDSMRPAKLVKKMPTRTSWWNPFQNYFNRAGRRRRQVSDDFDSNNDLSKNQTTENCVYSNPYDELWGLPSLKPQFSQCCKKTFCYRPKILARFTIWSEWSDCSNNCDQNSVRRRDCISVENNSKISVSQCQGLSKEVRSCQDERCLSKNRGGDLVGQINTMRLDEWSSWSECSESCGRTGVRKRFKFEGGYNFFM